MGWEGGGQLDFTQSWIFVSKVPTRVLYASFTAAYSGLVLSLI